MTGHTSESLEAGALRTALMRFVSGFSIEMTPREALKGVPSTVPSVTRVFLTRIPKADFADTVEASRILRRQGNVPVPHITARSIHDRDELGDQMASLSSVGVDEVLLIAGSQPAAVGEFDNTLQILRTGVFEENGIIKIGLAGHPEGHPQVSDGVLDAALLQKNAFATETGLQLYLMTQFFFDADPVIAWERRVRGLGNRLPVHVGFHGLTTATKLLKYAVSCGVGTSVKALSQRTNVLKLGFVRVPDRLLTAIVVACERDEQVRFARAHFYPFGAVAETAAWASKITRGRFEVKPDLSLVVFD